MTVALEVGLPVGVRLDPILDVLLGDALLELAGRLPGIYHATEAGRGPCRFSL